MTAVGVAAAVKAFGKLYLPDFSLTCDPDPPKLSPPDGRLDCEFADGDTIEMVNVSIAIVDLTRLNWKSSAKFGSRSLAARTTRIAKSGCGMRGIW
ncbi:MAG: hypothetical protein ACYDA3_01930 [Gaiellaceae bacterium]